MEVKGILLPLLMIIPERLGFIFCRKNQKLLMYLKASRLVWKMRRKERSLRLSKLIEVVNTGLKSLKIFVKLKVFEESSQQPIHRNKMVYKGERIKPFSTWFKAY